jgi:pantoate--beta-alanine ligase
MSPTPRLLRTLDEMRSQSAGWRGAGFTIGLVPTMGALHAGHLSLMEDLRRRCDRLVVSIFVNPSQFGKGEDLANYPRTLQKDLDLCGGVGVDAVFHPEAEEVYPPRFDTWIEPGKAVQHACGPWRPGHFRGVLTIVWRLFTWVQPQLAIFGRKDAQQLWLIQRMVQDLELPLTIVEGPLVREEDGLAMSSRNVYLGQAERKAAGEINRLLLAAARRIADGEPLEAIRHATLRALADHPLRAPQYLEILDWERFEPRDGRTPPGRSAVLTAVQVGPARLIDNVFIRADGSLEH